MTYRELPIKLKIYGYIKVILNSLIWLGILSFVSVLVPYILVELMKLNQTTAWYIIAFLTFCYVVLFFLVALTIQRKKETFREQQLSSSFFKIFVGLIVALILLSNSEFEKYIAILVLPTTIVVFISILIYFIDKYSLKKLATKMFTNTNNIDEVPEFPKEINAKKRQIINYLQKQIIKNEYGQTIRPTRISTQFKKGEAITDIDFGFEQKIFGFKFITEIFTLVVNEELK